MCANPENLSSWALYRNRMTKEPFIRELLAVQIVALNNETQTMRKIRQQNQKPLKNFDTKQVNAKLLILSEFKLFRRGHSHTSRICPLTMTRCIQRRVPRCRCTGRRSEQYCSCSWTLGPAAWGWPSPAEETITTVTTTNISALAAVIHLSCINQKSSYWQCNTQTHGHASAHISDSWSNEGQMQAATLPDLEDVFSWRDVRDVDPLTVDVGIVRVVAAGTQALSVQAQSRAHTHTWTHWTGHCGVEKLHGCCCDALQNTHVFNESWR